MQISGKSVVSDLCLPVSEQQDATLQQRKSRLSVGTAFDPLHFIHETLNHAIAPGHAASIGNSLRIVGQPINKSDQLGNPTSPDSGFPLLQAHLPLELSRASDPNTAQA